MSDPKDALRTAFDQALVTITRLKSTVSALERSRTEPIAIVGIGCRYPGGVTGPESFWRLLDGGVDAITEVPAERWDMDALFDADATAPGKTTTRSGGFLQDVDRFDPTFFGISPREAMSLEPQQQLLLETSWEAIEHAGIPAEELAGSNTGVFVGLSAQEAGSLIGGLEGLDGYATTGTAASVASGRISYVLGLQGPSISVDTGCSSSLVTVHLACQALRQRECSLALAGGVTVMLTPALFVEFSRLRGLAADGRCKSFAAAADGFGPSEGCGMLVLERLSDARKNRHPVLAVIRGSAVNQDGRSNGLTAPNGPSQEAVIRRALEQARVAPADVQYIECHGTGTTIGDPIEVQALGAVFGERRGREGARPLVIGSVKSNLGHPQAAGGVAGIIKVVLALAHRRIPKSLHFDQPSPHIPWGELPLTVAGEAVEWPATGPSRLAGVSAFGVSGTNAHVVIEEASREEATPTVATAEAAELLVLSAKSPEALDEAAARLLVHVDAHPEQALVDVAFSLATTRTQHEHRLALSVGSLEALRQGLAGVVRGESVDGSSRGRLSARRPKVVFVFPGQGSQWFGMGQELMTNDPIFRAAMEACDRAIAAEAGWSLIAELTSAPETSRLASIDVVQPALFAIGVALAATWRSYGVEPDAVIGHSMGEVAAAHVAGALSLEDAVAVICRRSRLLLRIRGSGEMAMVQLPVAEVQAALAGYEDEVSVAVSHSRRSTVISGTPSAIGAVLASLEARGVYCKRVKVDVASHSPQVDPLREELVAALAGLTPRAPTLRMESTVTGGPVVDGELTAGYWAQNLRERVRLFEVVERLLADGHGVFAEMSPHPVLLPAIEELRTDSQRDGAVVGSLHRERGARTSLLESVGRAWAVGTRIDLGRLFPEGRGRRVALPTYPWQRQRYWQVPAPAQAAPAGSLEAELRRLEEQGDLSEIEPTAVPKLIKLLEAQRVGVQIDTWFHAIDWRPVSAIHGVEPAHGHWVVLEGGSGLSTAVTAAMTRAGRTFELVPRANGIEGLRAALDRKVAIQGIVCAYALEQDGERDVLAVLRLVAGLPLDAGARPERPRCWLVTRGAVSIGPADPLTSPDQSIVWALGRTFALEHPRLWGGLVDVPSDGEPMGPATADLLVSSLSSKLGEDQLAVRKGGVFVSRLVQRAPRVKRAARWTTPGTALVTGGVGRIGLHVARWLVSRGVRHLLLTSRRGMDAPGAAEAVRELSALGAEVMVGRADVADAPAMAALVEKVAPPVTAIFHAAGAMTETPLSALQADHLARVLSPKREGARVLEELSRGWSLDAFVCFSSVAGVWGAGYLGAHAAASAFLDAWSVSTRARGVPATSVSWGLWEGEGQGNDEPSQTYLAKRGVRAMEPAAALVALERALLNGQSHAIVADIEWSAFRKGLEAWGARPLLADIGAGRDEQPSPGEVERRGAWARELAELAPAARVDTVVELVQAEVARVLLLPNASAVASDRLVRELGMDSLMAVALRDVLSRRIGTPLPATLAFDYPTPMAIAHHLIERVFGPAETAPAAEVAPRGDADDFIALGVERRFSASMPNVPAPSELRVSVNGLDHRVLEWSARSTQSGAERAETVLLVHGFLDAAGTWDHVAAALAARGLRVLAPAMRGLGDGPRLPVGTSYHFADHIADLAALIELLSPDAPVALVGHSMGGIVATFFAGAFPEKVARLVNLEGLGPTDSSFDMGPIVMRKWLDDLRALRTPTDPLLLTREEARQRLAYSHSSVARETLEHRLPHLVHEVTAPDGSPRVRWRFDPIHRVTSPAPFFAEMFIEFAKRVPCPVLFVSGGTTGLHPPDEEERLAAFGRLERGTIEGAGHMMHWTRPDEVVNLLDSFLVAR